MDNKTKRIIEFAKKQGLKRPFWNTYLFGVKLELNAVKNVINPGEKIYALIPCKYKGKRGLVIVTSIRVITIHRGYLGRFSNNTRDDVYYKQTSGGMSNGGFISNYEIQVSGGDTNDMIVNGLFGADADLLDKAYNKARQAYERHTYESIPNKKNNFDKKSKLKEMLDNNEITIDEYSILIKEV